MVVIKYGDGSCEGFICDWFYIDKDYIIFHSEKNKNIEKKLIEISYVQVDGVKIYGGAC